MKVCLRCKKKGFFSKDKSRKDGLCPYCKDCSRSYWQAWSTSNPEKVKKIKREKYAKVQAEAKKHLTACVDCGTTERLEFDHVRGTKKKDISGIRTWKALEEELPKCEVRCSSCHARRHNLGK